MAVSSAASLRSSNRIVKQMVNAWNAEKDGNRSETLESVIRLNSRSHLKCRSTGLKRSTHMQAYMKRDEDPNTWKIVNAKAQEQMAIAREQMMRQKARIQAKVVVETGLVALLPAPKNS